MGKIIGILVFLMALFYSAGVLIKKSSPPDTITASKLLIALIIASCITVLFIFTLQQLNYL